MRAGVETRKPGPPPAPLDLEHAEYLFQHGATYADLGRKYGISSVTIRKKLLERHAARSKGVLAAWRASIPEPLVQSAETVQFLERQRAYRHSRRGARGRAAVRA
jgi:hypothetical protein